ncbi:MAG: NADPH-dependent glutamate synthase [Bacillota bacterium]|nr:NADPH-dependent glutamate synthase [Bacillota bacterium]
MSRNPSLTQTPMPVQDPALRARNFDEVALGYSAALAVEEAGRCLDCRQAPCIAGCPVGVRIPDFIRQVAARDFAAAFDTITQSNSLPAVCGRVCPQETQCEARCVRGIKGEPVAIGRLERFVADHHRETVGARPEPVPANGHRVAVVGAGPTGLSCAADLAKLGYSVTIFEAFHTGGGVLVYGIPEFRLPESIVRDEIANLEALGVRLETNMVIGRVLTVDELLDDFGYEAVYLGTGAGLPTFLGIEGENLIGVYSANEYLTRSNLMHAHDERYDTPIRRSHSVAVIGGGNVAMDAARTALRLGAAEVTIVYRRSFEEMPARIEEIHHACEEGVRFENLASPTRILGDERGQVQRLGCLRMELGEPDASGRRRPVEIPHSDFELEVDTVIVAIGTSPNPLIRNTTAGLETNPRGCIVAAADGSTSRPGVFAGGDVVTGSATVILAMGAGKKAAAAIDAYIRGKTEPKDCSEN